METDDFQMLQTEAKRLLTDCWTVAFECPEFRPGPAMPGFISEHCVCGDMKYLHDVTNILRALARG
jgi:hypothetical protein